MVSTCLLALDGQGGAFALADQLQWEACREQLHEPESAGNEGRVLMSKIKRRPKPSVSALNYDEQRELRRLPERIDKAEQQSAAYEAAVAEVATDPDKLHRSHGNLAKSSG